MPRRLRPHVGSLAWEESRAAGRHSRPALPPASALPALQLLRVLPPPAACQLAGVPATLHRCAVGSLALAAYIQYCVIHSLPDAEEGRRALTGVQRQFVQSVEQQGAAALCAWQDTIQLFTLLVHAAVDAGVGVGPGSASLGSSLACFFYRPTGSFTLPCVLNSAVMGLHNAVLILQRAFSNRFSFHPASLISACPAAAGAALDTAEHLLHLVAKWGRLAEVVRVALPGQEESSICSVQGLLFCVRDCVDVLKLAFGKEPRPEVVLPGTAGEQLKRVGSLVATAVKAGRSFNVPDIPQQARLGLAGRTQFPYKRHIFHAFSKHHGAACASPCMQLPSSHMNSTHMHGCARHTLCLPGLPRPPAQDPNLSSHHKFFHNVLDSAGTLALRLLRCHPALLEPLRQGDTTQHLRSVGFVAFALIPAMVEVSCARLVRY